MKRDDYPVRKEWFDDLRAFPEVVWSHGLYAVQKDRSKWVRAYNVAADDPIVKEIFVEASPEVVFPYLTISEKYVQWMGLAAEIDVRPGGVYQFTSNTLDIITGEFLEVTPCTRIVFTWGWKNPGHSVPAGSTCVEIDLKPYGDGTLLRVTHRLAPADMKSRDELSWPHCIGWLGSQMGGGDSRPDPYSDPYLWLG